MRTVTRLAGVLCLLVAAAPDFRLAVPGGEAWDLK